MILLELEPRFLVIENPKSFRRVEDIEGADGIAFLCPVCFQANGGSMGTHQIICWRPYVSQEVKPRGARWEFQGSGLHNLTLAGSSTHLIAPCAAHFFVRDGEIVPA